MRPAALALEANHNIAVTHLKAADRTIQPVAEQILRLLGEDDPGQSSRDRPTGEDDPEARPTESFSEHTCMFNTLALVVFTSISCMLQALTSIYQTALDVLRRGWADRAELKRAASDILHLGSFMRFFENCL